MPEWWIYYRRSADLYARRCELHANHETVVRMTDSRPTQRRTRARFPLDHDPRRLRQRRLAAGLTLPELAELAQVSKGHLSEVENGTRNPSPRLLGRLARELRCEIMDILANQPNLVANRGQQ